MGESREDQKGQSIIENRFLSYAIHPDQFLLCLHLQANPYVPFLPDPLPLHFFLRKEQAHSQTEQNKVY